jgi:hypothetical protein
MQGNIVDTYRNLSAEQLVDFRESRQKGNSSVTSVLKIYFGISKSDVKRTFKVGVVLVSFKV